MFSNINQKPQTLLLSLTFLMTFGFAVWQALLNNFVIEKAQFTGVEIGILQSLREVPGFLAFSAVFVLLFIREQRFALISLALMFAGISLTGFFPSPLGLYITTIVMSIGFHYFETINKSLTLQWISKSETPEFLGQALAVKAIASLSVYGALWFLMGRLGVDYFWIYLVVGGVGIAATMFVAWNFKLFPQKSAQTKTLMLKPRYGLYYALVFLSGARRQIFVVFAGFLMVEKFAYSVADITLLFMVNYAFNLCFARKIGAFIGKVGERRALLIEYIGLIFVFTGYAFANTAEFAAALYVIDHMFFALSIAITTYFQKIADDRDIAATASVSFTINHIAAVVIPAALGLLWLYSHSLVFLVGTAFAFISLCLSLLIPRVPAAGNEIIARELFASRFSFGKS